MKKILSILICAVLLTSFATSPLKASANTNSAQTTQLIQLLMQMITILQAQLAVLTSQEHNTTEPVTQPVKNSLAPTITRINPTSASAGDTVRVYGANFNENTYISIDGIFGNPIWPDNAPTSGTGIFTFTVPGNLSDGSHTVGVYEKGSSFTSSTVRNSVTLRITSQTMSDTPIINSVTFRQDGEAGIVVYGKNLSTAERLEYMANCCKPTGEGTLSSGVIGKDSYVKFNLDTYLGNVEINGLTVRLVYSDGSKSDWETATISNTSSSQPTVTYTFDYSQRYENIGEGRIEAYLDYQIQNYRDGLVLDIQPTVNCDDTYIYPLKRECNNYLFDITGKATETYFGVEADPYVKGGASYRISAPNTQVGIAGYAKPGYVRTNGVTIDPIPDSIDFEFIIRDIKHGGAQVWSKTETVNFKG